MNPISSDVNPAFIYCPQYLRMLAVAYEKTQDLARDLRGVGCGDLDVEGTYMEFLDTSLNRMTLSSKLGINITVI